MMKRILSAAAIATALSAAGTAIAADKTVTLAVDNMYCSACPHIVKQSLAVIGAGSAGFSAVITAAEIGARVALIGHGTIGGTCVNTGCVPSKNLIRATEALHHAVAATRFGGIRAEARVEGWRTVVR